MLAFVEGRLTPEQEAQFRRALSEVPGALARAEAMRHDRIRLQAGMQTQEHVMVPSDAVPLAIERALPSHVSTGLRRRIPVLVGLGAVAAACIGWVIVVQSGWLTAKTEKDLSRLVINPNATPPPNYQPPAKPMEAPSEIDAFLVDGSGSRTATVQHTLPMVTNAAETVRIWPGRDVWGVQRPVDSAEAAAWLSERRLAVIIQVPDAIAVRDQARMLAALSTVSLGSPQAEVPPNVTARPGPSALSGSPPRSTHADAAAMEFSGLLDPGPPVPPDKTTSPAAVMRVLDDWLMELPLVSGGSMKLLALDDPLPAPPKDLEGTMYARRKLFLIRVEPVTIPGPEMRDGSTPEHRPGQYVDGPGR